MLDITLVYCSFDYIIELIQVVKIVFNNLLFLNIHLEL